MSISKKDLYLKHIDGLRLNDELFMRCLEEDTKALNNYSEKVLSLTSKGIGDTGAVVVIGKRKAEIDRGYEELKRRVMKHNG